MPFDITDARKNVEQLLEENTLLSLKLDFIEENLVKEGMIQKKDFENWLSKKYKEQEKEGK